MKRTRILSVLAACVLALGLVAGCAQGSVQSTPQMTSYESRTLVRAAALKGPTGIGMSKLMQDNQDKTTQNRYEFTLAGTADEITGKLITGDLDIAALPTNVALNLYNKTGGKVKIAAVNTLGVLYILQNGTEIQSVADLKGKTLYASGKGTTAEYILDYILTKNGIDPEKDITIEYKTEHSELATLAASGQADLCLLPEPFVTSVLSKNANMSIALNLSDEWTKTGETGKLTMGCIVVRSEFAENNPEVVKAFLQECGASVEYANANAADTAALCESFGIMGADVAEKAIPNCNMVFLTGDDMKSAAGGFLGVMYGYNAQSVGGSLPDDNFYYYAQ